MIDKIKTFLLEVKTETKKVTWPKMDELKASTMVVLVAVLIITAFISVVDLIVGKVLNFVMRLG
ncbi:MAG: preprotein translocase subunit SecE [Candidatus Eisenbacteria sp.]|nr:preprotein translocase subunit SecE [Candidatus Eisenbacteria bacterium]